MAEETVYFRDGRVQITNARFVVGMQTYAMRNITSVKGITIWPGRIGPIFMIVFGLLSFALVDVFPVFVGITGVTLICAGGLMLALRKPVHAVILATAGGEVRAYESRSSREIGQILDAINQAIVMAQK